MYESNLNNFFIEEENVGPDVICIDAETGNSMIPDAIDRGISVQITPELCVQVFTIGEDIQLTRDAVLQLIAPQHLKAIEGRYNIQCTVSKESRNISAVQAVDREKQKMIVASSHDDAKVDLVPQESKNTEVVPFQEPKFKNVSELQEYIFGDKESKKQAKSLKIQRKDKKRVLGLLKKLEKVYKYSNVEQRIYFVQIFESFLTDMCARNPEYSYNEARNFLEECKKMISDKLNEIRAYSLVLREVLAVRHIQSIVGKKNKADPFQALEDITEYGNNVSADIDFEDALREVEEFLEGQSKTPETLSTKNITLELKNNPSTALSTISRMNSVSSISFSALAAVKNSRIHKKSLTISEKRNKKETLFLKKFELESYLSHLIMEKGAGFVPEALVDKIWDNKELRNCHWNMRIAPEVENRTLLKHCMYHHPLATSTVATGGILGAVQGTLFAMLDKSSYDYINYFIREYFSKPLLLLEVVVFFAGCFYAMFSWSRKGKIQNPSFSNFFEIGKLRDEVFKKIDALKKTTNDLSKELDHILIRTSVQTETKKLVNQLQVRQTQLCDKLDACDKQLQIYERQIEETFFIACLGDVFHLPRQKRDETADKSNIISEVHATLISLGEDFKKIEKDLHEQEIGDKVKKEVQS